jgi:hypothetical protein
MKFPRIIALIALLGVLLLIASCERKIVTESEQTDLSCFTCHSDEDDTGSALILAERQWENSLHAHSETVERNRNYESYYAPCERCHTSEGFIALVSDVSITGEHFNNINCFTCHAPHTNGSLALRVQNAVTLENNATFDRDGANTCATCHHGRENVNELITADVTLAERWGPHHSTQSDLLIGENAYRFEGFQYVNSVGHPNSATEGCLDCHMKGADGYKQTLGGHSFAMESDEGLNTGGCNQPQCHDGAVTMFDFTLSEVDYDGDGDVEGIQSEVEGLLDDLQNLLETAGLMAYNADNEFLPIEDFETNADSAGAVFNYLYVYNDGSRGIHNPKFAIGLLQSSIDYLSNGSAGGPTLARAADMRVLPSH